MLGTLAVAARTATVSCFMLFNIECFFNITNVVDSDNNDFSHCDYHRLALFFSFQVHSFPCCGSSGPLRPHTPDNPIDHVTTICV